MLRIGDAAQLRGQSARHHLTLRESASGEYHSMLLFSFPAAPKGIALASGSFSKLDDGGKNGTGDDEISSSLSLSEAQSPSARWYCMEATCPHLGAPLENAAMEFVEDEQGDDIEDAVVVCPWHEYDFSLKTGESSTGLRACTFGVEERRDGAVYVDPGQGSWELVQVRAVTEAFAEVDKRQAAARRLHEAESGRQLEDEEELKKDSFSEIEYPSPAPRTLVAWAVLVLRTPEPLRKVQYTRWAAAAFRKGECKTVGGGRWSGEGEERHWKRAEDEEPPAVPPRKDLNVVLPGREGKRGKGGSEKNRIALLHSLANIELWAIDLAMDIIARAPHLASLSVKPRLLGQFYSDFLRVAEDEAKHFSLLCRRIEDMGARFGDLPVHHGLWDSATSTMHSLTARLSVIHLVHEARGLDVNPTTIKKFERAGDTASVETLTTIHLDEITHVSAGHRWLTWLCARMDPPRAPKDVFKEEVSANFHGRLKGPFNTADRAKAGLDRDWYVGAGEEPQGGAGGGALGVQRNEIAGG